MAVKLKAGLHFQSFCSPTKAIITLRLILHNNVERARAFSFVLKVKMNSTLSALVGKQKD